MSIPEYAENGRWHVLRTRDIPDGTLTTPKLDSIRNTGIEVFPASFETGEVGTVTLYFPFKATITKIRGTVRKALAATNAGTIQLKNHAGTNMTGGLLTFAASAAIGNEQSSVVTENNVINAGEKLQFVQAKTTVGGKVLVTVEYTRS